MSRQTTLVCFGNQILTGAQLEAAVIGAPQAIEPQTAAKRLEWKLRQQEGASSGGV